MDDLRVSQGAAFSRGSGMALNADAPAVTVRRCRHGFFMYPPGDLYVGRSLHLYGEYSESEAILFRRLLPSGGTAVEAGANIGALTVPLALAAGPKGHVFGFEPQRALFNILCGNLALNGLTNVTPLRAAAGRAAGEVAVPRLGYGEMENYGGLPTGGIAGRDSDSVPVLTVDGLNLDRLDLLKADVEGAEAEVVAGAAATVARLRPAIYVENDRRERSAELISLLLGMEYRLWWHLSPLYRADNFHANPENVFGKTISINMLCLPAERKAVVEGLRPVEGADDWWRAEP